MTCIAWDGKTMAADRRINFGGMMLATPKIKRIGQWLVGGAGEAGAVQAVMRWVEAGMYVEDYPEVDDDPELLMVSMAGQVYVLQGSPHAVEIASPQVAVGTGRAYAMAAMHLGCTAEQAVEVAAMFDPECGHGVDTLSWEV